MSTTIRPELSEKNQYWIDKHRYYELKHFCLQYPLWKRKYSALINSPSGWTQITPPNRTNAVSDPITPNIDERLFYADRIKMVEQIAREADETLSCYILEGVTKGLSYDLLRVRSGVPCGKDTYYDLYRRFFWLLSKERR